jgi:hypothetical protein
MGTYKPVKGIKGDKLHHAKLIIEAKLLLTYLCEPDGNLYEETKKVFSGHVQRKFAAQVKKLHKQLNTPFKVD